MNNGKPKLCTSEEHPIPETDSITSVCLSRDQRYLLVNTTAEEMHVWDLDERALVNSYRGQKQARFVIRSAFGGHEDSYIVSGCVRAAGPRRAARTPHLARTHVRKGPRHALMRRRAPKTTA